MATLLRVDPPRRLLRRSASSTTHRRRRAQERDGRPTWPSTTRPTTRSTRRRRPARPRRPPTQTTITVASAAGFPAAGAYYVRIDNEVLQVTGGQGTTTWTVVRGQLGHGGGHARRRRRRSPPWPPTGTPGSPACRPGAQNLKVTLQGQELRQHDRYGVHGADHQPAAADACRICNWTIAGAAGCSTATSSGWVTLAAAARAAAERRLGRGSGSDHGPCPAPANAYIGTGSYKGQVRVLVHTQRWTATDPDPVLDLGQSHAARLRRAMRRRGTDAQASVQADPAGPRRYCSVALLVGRGDHRVAPRTRRSTCARRPAP